tara:strand:- start:241 stop:468 length:228 start_codon:yes stop_codon:yes gene_type:complete
LCCVFAGLIAWLTLAKINLLRDAISISYRVLAALLAALWGGAKGARYGVKVRAVRSTEIGLLVKKQEISLMGSDS